MTKEQQGKKYEKSHESIWAVVSASALTARWELEGKIRVSFEAFTIASSTKREMGWELPLSMEMSLGCGDLTALL